MNLNVIFGGPSTRPVPGAKVYGGWYPSLEDSVSCARH